MAQPGLDRFGSGPDGSELEVADFRAELHAWLDAHHDELAPPYRAARARSTSRSRRCNA